jgi:hypothetical protein
MLNTQLGLIQSTTRELNSARPDAPVVHERTHVAPSRRSRAAVAGLLERAAAAVAPSEYSPAR